MLILKIFWGLLGLGIIVFIHEAGHFLAAKLSGVDVETFSLGWGKKLIGFRYKGTMYQIAWFPIGGYCKMRGEMQAPVQVEKDAFQKLLHEPGTFMAAAWWKKVLISLAGPLANILFAILIFMLTALIGYNYLSSENRIILADMERETPARIAGLETGDRILEVAGREITNFEDFAEIVRKNPEKPLAFLIERDSRLLEKTVVPEEKQMMGLIGVYGWNEPVLTSVEEDSPAAQAGFQVGDRIITLNGEEVENDIDIAFALREQPASLEIRFRRNGTPYTRVLEPVYDEAGNTDLGMGFLQTYRTPRVGVGRAFIQGIDQSLEILEYTLKGFALLFSAPRSELKDAVAGPIRITQMVGEVTIFGFKLSVSDGIITFFRFICMLCVIVAFMNLLPIPALDGGQILLSVYMALVKDRITMKFLYRYQVVGFFIVFLLLTIAVFSDIFNVIG